MGRAGAAPASGACLTGVKVTGIAFESTDRMVILRLCARSDRLRARARRAGRTLAASLLAAGAVSGCGDPIGALLTDDCKDEMNATRSEFGEPDRITDAPHYGDLRLQTWWYTTRGFSRSFSWGEAYRDCETTDKAIEAGG